MSEQQPRQPLDCLLLDITHDGTAKVISALLGTQEGVEPRIFRTDDTLIRQFDSDWSHCGYIFQQSKISTLPIIYHGFPRFREFLVGEGFKTMRAPEPEPFERELYIQYAIRSLGRMATGGNEP